MLLLLLHTILGTKYRYHMDLDHSLVFIQSKNRSSHRFSLVVSVGTEFTDKVTLASDLVITSQSIGVASTSTGFSGTDGIIG